MTSFTYLVQCDYGVHIGPASRMSEIAKMYPETKATLTMGSRKADISKTLQLLTMGVRKGDMVTITCEGETEVELLDVLYQYFEERMGNIR
ncbi:MAG: HPr family phosphocarrier protein [Dorea sp.]|nr:HPr family phosphocarrier protein [Dorea sp.]